MYINYIITSAVSNLLNYCYLFTYLLHPQDVIRGPTVKFPETSHIYGSNYLVCTEYIAMYKDAGARILR